MQTRFRRILFTSLLSVAAVFLAEDAAPGREPGPAYPPLPEVIEAAKQPRLVHRMVPAADDVLLVLGGAARTGNVAATETVALAQLSPDSPQRAASGTSAGSIWPGFRGRGDNVAAARDLPQQWSPTENIAWKIDLPGFGQSSPVVWGRQVFVTAVDGPERDKGFVLAYDAATGKELWRHTFAPTQKAKWSTMISRAAPTPVVDAAAVYAFFEGGDLLALSHTGELLWSRSLVKEYGEFENGHGLAASPALTRDAVVALIDHQGPSYLLGVDKKTGKNLWKVARTSRSSWTSPVVAMRDNREEVIVSSNGSVAGYDAATGKLLWEHSGLTGNSVPSASVAGTVVLIGASVGRMGGSPRDAARSNCCLRLVDQDGKPGYELLWSARSATSSFATPLAYRGHAYFVSQEGIVYCLDLQTGKECGSERIDGSCWASPLAAGEHVYFFGKDGRTTVFKAGPTLERVAANALWEETDQPVRTGSTGKEAAGKGGYRLGTTVYGVAAVDGAFFVRTGTALYRLGRR